MCIPTSLIEIHLENMNFRVIDPVTVLDSKEGEFDFHIYMNNILNHRGYRFFQSSFESYRLRQPVELCHSCETNVQAFIER